MIALDVTTSWHSYPSTFQLGHKGLADLLLDPVAAGLPEWYKEQLLVRQFAEPPTEETP